MSTRKLAEIAGIIGGICAAVGTWIVISTSQDWPPFGSEVTTITEQQAMTFVDDYRSSVAGPGRDLSAAWNMVVRGSPAETENGRTGFNRFWKTYGKLEREGSFERVGEQSFRTTLTYTPAANGRKIREKADFVLRRVDGDVKLYEIRKVGDP